MKWIAFYFRWVSWMKWPIGRDSIQSLCSDDQRYNQGLDNNAVRGSANISAIASRSRDNGPETVTESGASWTSDIIANKTAEMWGEMRVNIVRAPE